MTDVGLQRNGGRSLLMDPSQILAWLQRLRMETPQKQYGAPTGKSPAFDHQRGPLTEQNYLLNPSDYPRVAQVASRIPHQMPAARFTAPQQPAPGTVSIPAIDNAMAPFRQQNFTLPPQVAPDLSGAPSINATVDPIPPFDPANTAAILQMAGLTNPAPASPPGNNFSLPPELQVNAAGQEPTVQPIEALDPGAFAAANSPPPVTSPATTVQPQGPTPATTVPTPPSVAPTAPPVPTSLPSAFRPQIAPPVAPNPQVANLRFPIGHTPAISMGASTPLPMAEGGPTPAEMVPPAALRRAAPQLGAGFRPPPQMAAPVPAPAPQMPHNAPLDSSLAGVPEAIKFLQAHPMQPTMPAPAATPPAPPAMRTALPSPQAPEANPPVATGPAPRIGDMMPQSLKEQLLAEAFRLTQQRNQTLPP